MYLPNIISRIRMREQANMCEVCGSSHKCGKARKSAGRHTKVRKQIAGCGHRWLRSPKMPVPTRTIVAPSSMATS